MRTRRTLGACLVLLAATWAPAAQSPPPLTVDDLMGLSTIVDARISPDGGRVAYVVSTPSVATNRHETSLFVVPSTGGSPTRLAEDAAIFTPALPVPRLRWAPDGRRVSFLGVEDGRPQVQAVSTDGGPVVTLTTAAQGVTAYEWAPDGSAIAYLMREAAAPALVQQVGTPPPRLRLWVQPRDGAPRVLTPAGETVDGLSWSPDARQIAYSSTPASGFTAPYFTRLFLVPAAGGASRSLVDRVGMNTQPRFSPDGTAVAFITTNERMGLIAPRGLAIVRLDEDPPRIRSYPLDGAWVGEMAWAHDSRAVYATFNEGTFARGPGMFEMPVVRVDLEDGRATRVGSGAQVHYSISLSDDGAWLASRVVEGRSMGEIVVRDLATDRTRTLTDANPQLRGRALGTLEPVSWRSFDGMEIWGLLLRPPGARAGTPLPLLVYCHGGPIGGVTHGLFPQFMHVPGQVDPYGTEAMAAAGYAVLFPMPRGGSGYGEEGHKAIIGRWGGPDYQDIMVGIDYLISEGVADPDRLGVMGASYGGFLTNWIVTQTTRFKAASAGASIADLSDLYYLPDGGDLLVEYFDYPWAAPEAYRAHSPITHVKHVVTPLLLQHGERDPRVPLAGPQRMFRALTALGKSVEFDIYPRGGHVLYEPVQQRESMRRNLEWFRRWIPAGEGR